MTCNLQNQYLAQLDIVYLAAFTLCGSAGCVKERRNCSNRRVRLMHVRKMKQSRYSLDYLRVSTCIGECEGCAGQFASRLGLLIPWRSRATLEVDD